MKRLPARDDLGAILIELAGDDSSGLLRVQHGEEEKTFRFSRGELKDLAVPSKAALPERAIAALLISTGREKAWRKGLKAAQKAGISVTDAVLRGEEVSLHEVAEAVKEAVLDEVAEALSWENPQVEIVQDARGFKGDVGERFDLYMKLDEIYIDAMRRLGRWDGLAETLPELREVYYATPSAGRLVADPDAYPNEIEILNQVDGHRMAREVIALAAIDPFDAFATVRSLAAAGDIAPLNPVELFQHGEAARDHDPARAAAILERARERGLDDFDIQRRLAELYEEIGDPARALERWREFAEKCTAQFRLEDTIEALEKIVHFDPEDLEAREKYISLLLKADRPEEADTEILHFAHKAVEACAPARAARTLARRLEGGERTAELLEAAATLADAAGDAATARARREELAELHLAAGETRKALEVYQQLFCDGHADLGLRWKLIDIHIAAGDKAKAEEHIESLLEGATGVPISSRDDLRELHRKRCELRPGDRRSTWYLADDAASRGEKKEAAEYLRSLARTLAAPEDIGERTAALERIVELDPVDLDASWNLVLALEEADRKDEAREILGKAARQAVRLREFDRAEKFLRRILRASPLDPAVREEYMTLAIERKDSEAAALRARDLVFLRRLVGDLPRALSVARERFGNEPADGFALLDLAGSLAEEDDPKEAADLLVRAGKIFLSTGNPGLARRCGETLTKIDPARPEAKEFLRPAEPPHPVPPPPPFVAPSPSGPEPTLGAPTEPLVKKAKLDSITARLKSFKTGLGSGSAPREGTDAGASEADRPSEGMPAIERSLDSAPEVRKAKLQGPASKLSALRRQAELTP